ncbi:lytic murein transglycosylase B [Gilvimarinus sp. SDUM040013]|uniref:Lytic murein transglycosylase B n=1 Tax=Gilvimarinus gilvus TaxID=3058038 RepID=A0ABU4RWL3_9GAMM|nr:lytic murein transglycosylase B [Gilvimarinus sp. SDUM040013]MDO3385284.1 lytic murein transglycosylase B [Gilvimarinus sp. SDUM040013]MDX6849267.1 lytic murein transglycosylase B [Gilvimarinus sp. SDUM040013]
MKITRRVNLLATYCLLVFFVMFSAAVKADYSEHPSAQPFIARMVEQHDFDSFELTQLFKAVEKKQSILDTIARPAEKTKSWADYRKIFIKPARIEGGVSFWLDNAEALLRAERAFGVPAEYIVAIIGVETLYGKITGSYRVMDALSTLAFDYPPRSPFFTKELEHYLLLTREHGQDPLLNKGSYAGAMGLGQFMPSSYREYAVDFNGDSWPDIWQNKADAIGSVANYFHRHGWQAAQRVTVRARPNKNIVLAEPKTIAKPELTVADWMQRGLQPVIDLNEDVLANAIVLDGALGDEYWLTMNNFYVITRYNRSAMYAMAVDQLAQAIYREGFDKVEEKLNP